ncbi:MAG TPA: sulfotransferase family protein [Chloroflexi bacterium]|nr:sulfotransferase family protein [Chloroflexota bacterium]
MDHNVITIVSGLPRSGTSMMMKMLHAGGMSVLSDGVRTADVDNPKGYYEFERVKQLEHDRDWLIDAQGKAVKIISALLEHLPSGYVYKIIFMRRPLEEILASQRQMLIRRGEPTDRVSDDRLAALFRQHLAQVEAWLSERPHIEVIYVDYHDILENPDEQVTRINQFLENVLDVQNMTDVIDASLYRQRL